MNLRRFHLRASWAAIVIVLVAVGFMAASTQNDSPIVDEVPHIGAGYSYVRMLDMRLNPEHPPLIKDLAGLALLPLPLNERAFALPQWTDQVNGQWTFGRAFIFGSENNADIILRVARLPMLGVFLLGAWLVWLWARKRSGETGALIAVTLYAFSPTIMAHGRFVTTDMGAAIGVLAATYTFLQLLRAPTRRSFIWAFIALGLALLAKFSTVLLGPFFLGIALLYGLDGHWFAASAWRRALRMLGLTAAVGTAAFVGVVVPVYTLQTWNYPMERQLADTETILDSHADSLLKSAILWGADKPVIRGATHWALGLAMVQQRSAGGNTIYWMGRVVTRGGPSYFPTVYFLKEPLAWWLLVSAAITALIFHHRRRRGEHARGHWWSDNFDEWVWLLWLAIYWTVSIRSTLNIGVRHLLPIYPFAILLVSGRIAVLLEWLKAHDARRWRITSLVIALILGWYSFEAIRVWPSSLSYFNQIAGGPSGGYRFVADSNLDWGQDLKRLAQWAEANDVRAISLDYFGWADPAYYLKGRSVWTTGNIWKDANDFAQRNASDGWIAVSATFLQEATNRPRPSDTTYRWLLEYPPEIVIGNSIFVWHIPR
ncbi:MAG: glycosyltransferase family 39 protein [Candidatus Yanofskybacteria bacterium]|nr:glycosyltransferase family 39 protein [Candidatus Yanofskybacteria bacterium]